METALNDRAGAKTPTQQKHAHSTTNNTTDSDYGRLSSPPHTLEVEPILKAYSTDPEAGLSEEQVAKYRQEFGPNKLKETPPPSFLSILVRNTLNAMTIVLIAAMAVSELGMSNVLVWLGSGSGGVGGEGKRKSERELW